MITTLLATFIMAAVRPQDPVPASPQNETAVQIVQKVLARYAAAKTIVGKITLTQTANGVTVNSETDLQYERPSSIFLRQVYQGLDPRSGGRTATVKQLVSDGKRFAYDRPEAVVEIEGRDVTVGRGKPRYIELVTQNGYQQSIQDMYTAERISLVDKSPLLDVAIGRTQDLKDLMGQWAALNVYGKAKVNEAEVTAVVGNFREDAGAPISGTFEAYFSPNYDFVRYLLKQRFAVPGHPDKTVEVTSLWDSTLKVDGEVNPALFKDVK